MNDRFKFRAWNKETKTMHYKAEQAYDCMTGTPLFYKSSFGDVLDDENYIVEQCTGLKDKNGKLIYEGDVLSDYDGFKILVRWDDLELKYGFVPVLKNNTEDLDIYPNECEVIGNIHQNPELMK